MRAFSTALLSGIIGVAFLSGCSGTMKPMHTERATHGTVSEVYSQLKELPEPQEKIVAAVYRFRDQTGQYKPSDRVASWSTAVTQGATSILMKAMEESGWFVPIERESISNLLNERQIIQSIRQQHSGPQGPQPLPPLLFAGVMLEGGIVGYDTNVITGGIGARYLGTGGSSQYRKDQVTIYLRAVSTQSGRVLKTVHTTKSIISQQLDSGVFRFIDTNRLLESEAGYTYNEPPVMAVTEAIDEAVKQLILEGVEESIWTPKNPDEIAAYREQFNFEKQKEDQLKRDYFGLIDKPDLRSGWSLTTNAFSKPVNAADLLLNVYITPGYNLSPFMAAGGGAYIYDKKHPELEDQILPFFGLETGFDYRFNNRLGARVSTSYRYLLIDGLDGVTMGKYNDQHWGVNVGFTYRPGFLN